MLGFTLIFTDLSLLWINVIGSVVFALLVPYVALARALLYFDLGVRTEEEPANPGANGCRDGRRLPRPRPEGPPGATRSRSGPRQR